MNTRHDNADGPEDIDKAFAEIVAELERDNPLPRWPDDGDRTREIGTAPRDERSSVEELEADPDGEQAGPRDWAPHDWAPAAPGEDDEGHFEPPEPPPVPTPKAGTVGGIMLIFVGLVLLLVPGLAGSLGTFALPAGLVSISAGIGWLLLRMRRAPPESRWDDGAQV